VKELSEEIDALVKSHDNKLLEQRCQLEADMDSRMRVIEEDAARHLASIRADADEAQAALTHLPTKNRELEEQCALVVHKHS
jgi:hypothetical protein